MEAGTISERDVVVIGLGEFGKKVIDLFNGFLEERRHQIDPQHLKKITVYTIDFQTTGTFNYTTLSDKIVNLVKDSPARKFNGKFSYIIIGDLYDIGTSTYAIDYAYLPWVMEKAGVLKKQDVLGFFTFADAYGATVKADDKAMASILRFLKRMNDIDRVNHYIAPYKDPNGHDFGEISSPTGPFERDYVIVTPGTQEELNRDTSLVFAERIFYELYYLSPIYTQIEVDKNGERRRKDGKQFSSFSMIQISRLEDLQHYFLKYVREDEISEYLLAERIKGTDFDYYLQGFFDLVDVPESEEFPIDRSVNLFIRENENDLHLLDMYQTTQNKDFNNYVDSCRKRIEKKLEEFTPKYTEFTRTQIDHMLTVFERGYSQLFNINRLTGNINTYIFYVETLAARLSYWEESLKKILDDETNISLESNYEEAEREIKKIQRNWIYKIPLFVPIRRKLIENVILSLPLEDYLKANIRKNLARSFLDQWEDKSSSSRNPVKDCNELVDALKKMKELMENKKTQIRRKIDFISKMPTYYYIISEKEQGEYSEILSHLKSEHFGASKKTDLEKQAKEFFKNWTEGKNRQKITLSSEFIRYFDDFIESKTETVMESLATNKSNTDEFGRWAEDAVNSMEMRTEQLSHKSFKSDAQAIGEKRLLLNPKRAVDQLSEKIKNKKEELLDTEDIEVPREFTLGSVVYFQDKLWMSEEESQKWENLKQYAGESLEEPKYADSAEIPSVSAVSKSDEKAEILEKNAPTEENLSDDERERDSFPSEDEMTYADKCVRSVLLDFCEPWVRVAWYKGKFGEDKETLSDDEIRKLSKEIDISDLLQGVEEKPLHDFAKEIGCRLSPIKERQIEIIIKHIKRQENQK